MSKVDIILAATNASAAVRQLYLAERDATGTSIAGLCRGAGIPSKGYLGDVMQGRRKLKREYHVPLAKALGLKGLGVKYFATLAELDLAVEAKKRSSLERKLEGIRKALLAVQISAPRALSFDAFAFEVFCAFGLFGATPRRDELIGYFGAARTDAIDSALASLEQAGYIRAGDGRYEVLSQQITFTTRSGNAHMEFLRQAILDAEKAMVQWLPRRELAYFESTILSVDRDQYRLLLAKLRDEVQVWQADLETPSANVLVRFNAQVYPLGE